MKTNLILLAAVTFIGCGIMAQGASAAKINSSCPPDLYLGTDKNKVGTVLNIQKYEFMDFASTTACTGTDSKPLTNPYIACYLNGSKAPRIVMCYREKKVNCEADIAAAQKAVDTIRKDLDYAQTTGLKVLNTNIMTRRQEIVEEQTKKQNNESTLNIKNKEIEAKKKEIKANKEGYLKEVKLIEELSKLNMESIKIKQEIGKNDAAISADEKEIKNMQQRYDAEIAAMKKAMQDAEQQLKDITNNCKSNRVIQPPLPPVNPLKNMRF